MLKDFLGREFKPGDKIVYPVVQGNYPLLRMAEVVDTAKVERHFRVVDVLVVQYPGDTRLIRLEKYERAIIVPEDSW